MATAKDKFYEKKAEILIKKLQARHFDACYCPTGEDAVQKILEQSMKDVRKKMTT